MKNRISRTGLFLIVVISGLAFRGYAQEFNLKPGQVPSRFEISYAKLFSKNVGYIYTVNQQLFKFKEGHWFEIALPGDIVIKEIFAVTPEDVWITVQIPPNYHEQFMQYRNGRWKIIPAPNVDQIRDMYFEDDHHGWAVGDWGEMLRYENGKWRSVHSPTRRHIKKIFADPHGNLYAYTDYRLNFELLYYKHSQWQVLRKFPPNFQAANCLGDDKLILRWDNQFYLAQGDSIIPLNMPKFTDFAYFPDGTGYGVSSEGIFFLQDTSARKIESPKGFVAEKITLSPDGHGWFYRGSPGLWRLGEKSWQPSSNNALFHISQRYALGRVYGGAFIALSPHLSGFYLAKNDGTNLLLLREWPDETGGSEILNLKPVTKYGLQEPQRTRRKELIYDLGVLAADFNNDGREDIFLTSLYGKNCLFLNLGRGKFKNVANWAGLHERVEDRYTIAATADVDNDGDLDLFLPNELGPSYLYLNDGLAHFSDRTAGSGIHIPLGGKAAAFADIDQDGWIDLAVTTFGEGTFLFRNLGQGKFQDITALTPALQTGISEKVASLSFADYDNDGDLDLFICKLLASNQLLENDGSGKFMDVTEKAGLADSNLSRGATFFDFDNDGDLDLFITNMGIDRYYMNNGKKRFTQESKLLDVGVQASWLGSENAAIFYGGFSTGTIQFDFNNDGDMDLLVLSYDRESYLVKNESDNHHFIGFRLSGQRSNRSAIGAVVQLYPAGRAGDATAILATRMIESTSAYASHSQKLIHFGVNPDQKYDAVIRFPGGRVRTMKNLQPGQYYDVNEIDGWAAKKIRAVRKSRNWLLGYRGNLRMSQFILWLFLVILMNRIMQKRSWWQNEAGIPLIFLLLLGFFFSKAAYTYQSDVAFLLVPLGVSLFTGIASIVLYKQWRVRHSPHASFEALSMKLEGFEHSKSAANLFTSLEFQLNNWPVDESPEQEFLLRCVKTIQAIEEQVLPEIYLMFEFLTTLHLSSKQANLLIRALRKFTRQMARLKRKLKSEGSIEAATIARTKEVLKHLREQIRKLRQLVKSYEICEVNKALEQVVAAYENSELTITSQKPDRQILAHISPSEFRAILAELIANAERAMQETHQKNLQIEVTVKDRVYIDIIDTGKGIPQNQWEAIFKRDFSTRKDGGLGLYYARYTLERFKGSIFVKESKTNQGSVFRISLQKAEAK